MIKKIGKIAVAVIPTIIIAGLIWQVIVLNQKFNIAQGQYRAVVNIMAISGILESDENGLVLDSNNQPIINQINNGEEE